MDGLGDEGTPDDEWKLGEVLQSAISFINEETLLQARFENAIAYEFPTLRGKQEWKDFEKRLDLLVYHLGGPPKLMLVKQGEKAPPQDDYPQAAIMEAMAVFDRARKSVVLADLYALGSTVLSSKDSPIEWTSEVARNLMVPAAEASFWEHAETAFIRLHSYWDRVGQVLDFAFFNIRQFDRNGFAAVMDRISSNTVPMNPVLARNGGWKAVRSFQTRESEDGFKWLQQRRNLLVHSLHLHPLRDSGEDVFESQFNHLERAHKDKLRPRSPIEETRLLRKHLELAAKHFENVLATIQCSPSREGPLVVS